MHKLLLMVTNAFMLERGTLPYCYFDLSGGFVGSGINTQWKINNLKNEFSNVEFEIKYYNANFCLITHSKNIFINSSTRPLSEGGIIKLNDNDLISLFNYKLRAKIFTNEAEMVTLQDELSYLINKITDKKIFHSDYRKEHSFTNIEKESSELLTLNINKSDLDPLLALKVSEDNDSGLIGGTSHQTEITDYKLFNPHIENMLESYIPTEFNTSFNEYSLNNSVTNDVLSQSGSSPRKKEMKKEDVILDPLFFIK
ncbi:hypothetical protein BKG93_11060 [Rodentibacter ratti]|uniref:FHA domain-containing protein n=1 Tax=Rodentibacter ratti TaxID=1906745 RepID=A0A1V3KY90_9PAST|nr:hypothetical protein [Rodentibacter ratti]OOF82634.1 hypothetical protein BKG93_11060 [Rodentibacter ratti]